MPSGGHLPEAVATGANAHASMFRNGTEKSWRAIGGLMTKVGPKEFALVLGASIALLFVVSLVQTATKPPPTPAEIAVAKAEAAKAAFEHDRRDSKFMCEQFVKDQLKAPSTAKF